MSPRAREVEVRVAQWLATHHGVVTRARARRLGMTDAMIATRLRRREWVRVHPGVFVAASSAPTPMQGLLAALAAAGPGALASHLSAAWLWGLVDEPPAEPWIVTGTRREIKGVRLTRSPDRQRAVRQGMPCTTAPRTLVDCAAVVRPATLADLVDRALATRAVTIAGIRCLLDRSNSRRAGRAALRASLEARGYLGGPAPSVLESKMARLLGALDIPLPTAEVRWSGSQAYRLDFAFVERKLIVEVDGYAWHSSPERMRNDQRRRNALLQAGWDLRVYTWKEGVEDGGRVAGEIVAAYHARPSVAA